MVDVEERKGEEREGGREGGGTHTEGREEGGRETRILVYQEESQNTEFHLALLIA